MKQVGGGGMAWHGMAWHGMAWHGMAWEGAWFCFCCASQFLELPHNKTFCNFP